MSEYKTQSEPPNKRYLFSYLLFCFRQPPDGTDLGSVFRKNPLRGEDGLRYVTTPENGEETIRTRARAVSDSSPIPESISRSRTESRSGSEGVKRMRDPGRSEEEISEEAVKKKLKLHEESMESGPEAPEEESIRGKEKALPSSLPLPPRPPPPPHEDTSQSGELEEGELDA